MEKIKIAVFDFCGTFVNFETGDEFVRYLLEKTSRGKRFAAYKKKIAFFRKTRIEKVYNHLFSTPLSKKLLVKEIKGIPNEVIENLSNEFVSKRLLPCVIGYTANLFSECKKKQYRTVLVSAAYNHYLTKFSEKYKFDTIISSQLEIKKGFATGRIEKDVIGKKKVFFLKKWLKESFGNGMYEIVLSVSDSKKDIPILDLAKQRVVISKHHQTWIKDDYKEHLYGD